MSRNQENQATVTKDPDGDGVIMKVTATFPKMAIFVRMDTLGTLDLVKELLEGLRRDDSTGQAGEL